MIQPDFRHVDAADPAQAVSFLDLASSLPGVRRWKRFGFQQMALRRGHRVLDVGCGTGLDAIEIGRRVGRSGAVVGVDLSHELVAIASERARGRANISFRQADIFDLPFVDGTFDRTRIDRVLHFLGNPDEALREVIRVTASGGIIAITEPDWSSLQIHGGDTRLTEAILPQTHALAPEQTLGRRLARLMTKQRLHDISVSPSLLSLDDFAIARTLFGLDRLLFAALQRRAVSAAEAKEWLVSLANAGKSGDLRCELGGAIATASVL